MKRKFIYVLTSFRVEDTKGQVDGCTYWFSTKVRAIKYLKNAGQPVPGKENVYYDDPFEYRYNLCVIEKVFEGPMSTNEIVGFWQAEYTSHGRIKGVVQCVPFDTSRSFNFTGVG